MGMEMEGERGKEGRRKMGFSVSAFNWGENAEMTKGGENPALDSTLPPPPIHTYTAAHNSQLAFTSFRPLCLPLYSGDKK